MIRKDMNDVVLQDREGQVSAPSSSEIVELPRDGPAGAGRHGFRRKERDALQDAASSAASSTMVLNAKYHEQRGGDRRPGRASYGAVTIATNMAGRGTDILLGGNAGIPGPHARCSKAGYEDERDRRGHRLQRERRTRRCSTRATCSASCSGRVFKKETDAEARPACASVGGLHIIGTERHESRRIDNQLRGRAGRQGDPGSSQFFISLEDDLMRLFGSERVSGHDGKAGHGRGRRRSRRRCSPSRSRTPRSASRAATTTSARTCCSTTT